MRIRNYSERTVTAYIGSLSQLSLYYNRSPDTISLKEFKSYAYHLIHDKLAATSTINCLISAWRILQVDILGNNWDSIPIKRPRREKRLPEVLSQEDVKLLIATPSYFKHRMLLAFTYATGMRRNEVVNVKLKDIDRKRKAVRVVAGKGNKSRDLPLSESLLLQLDEYFSCFSPKKYVFEGIIPGKPYSGASFASVVKKAGLNAGLIKNVYPHMLRHSFASHMIENGLSIKLLQYLMGHSSLNTTLMYLHLVNPSECTVPDLLAE